MCPTEPYICSFFDAKIVWIFVVYTVDENMVNFSRPVRTPVMLKTGPEKLFTVQLMFTKFCSSWFIFVEMAAPKMGSNVISLLAVGYAL